jgi:twitching motility protein PilI
MKLPSEALKGTFVLDDEPELKQEQSGQKFQVITSHAVRIGNIGLLLPSNEESELVENLSVCRLPNTPTWFNGVTSLRGNMIPVFDIHELLGFEGRDKECRLIIVGITETAAAFWVDEMPRMVMVTSDDITRSSLPLPRLIKDHSRNFFFKDDQIWIDWDVNSFFSTLGKLL